MNSTSRKRSTGPKSQNNLYQRLKREVARYLISEGIRRGSENQVMTEIDMIFKLNFHYEDFHGYRNPLSSASEDMTVEKFHDFFENCQQFSSEVWGVSAFSVDKKEGYGVV